MTILASAPVAAKSSLLEGRVALVTGSTSGIGLDLARAFAAAGSAVILNGFGRPDEIAETLVGIAAEYHVAVRFSPADPARASSAAGMIAMTLDTFGRLDILVNNAGIRHTAPLEQFDAAAWDAILAANLSSVFHTTRLALPVMRRNGFGRIINIAPAAPLSAATHAARHGLVGLTRATAIETAGQGITCNAICLTGGAQNLGALSVFLGSDAAASMTGMSLPFGAAAAL